MLTIMMIDCTIKKDRHRFHTLTAYRQESNKGIGELTADII
jgi:hypothetical protein